MTGFFTRCTWPPLLVAVGIVLSGWATEILHPMAPYCEIGRWFGVAAGLSVWLGFKHPRSRIAALLWAAVWLAFLLAGSLALVAMIPLLTILAVYTGARAAGRGRRVAVFLFTLTTAYLLVETSLDLSDPAGAVPDLLDSEKLRTWQLRNHTDLLGNLEREGMIGLRGDSWTLTKPAGVKRVVCLGSSSTWGPGLEANQTYPAQLAERLGEGYQVANAGCSGYNSFQLGIFLEQVLLPASPDLVIFYYGGNEIFGQDSVAYWRYVNDLLAPVVRDDPDFREKVVRYGTSNRFSVRLLDFVHGLRALRPLRNRLLSIGRAVPFTTHPEDVLDSAALLDDLARAVAGRGLPLLLIPEIESGVGICLPDYARLMSRVAAAYPHTIYLDFASELRDPESFQDPVHLSPAGAARLAELLAPHVLERLAIP